MAKTVFDVLIHSIDEQISSAQIFLKGGSPKDYPAYREIVGLIRGLEASKSYIEDLSRNYRDNDDD
jgi:hypothetical protein|tara:strand:+ start:2740 stop:2937 length:198 start_codon:yes stop_codon:yes gene_type:complete